MVVKGFQSPALAGFGFLCTGALLLPLFWIKGGCKTLTFQKAFIIGIMQAAAVLPGLSRSGATIAAGVFLQLPPERAARFSFLISVPAIAGSLLAAGFGGGFSSFSTESIGKLAAAFAAAYISGAVSLKVLMSFLNRGILPFFSFYVILLGGFLLFFQTPA